MVGGLGCNLFLLRPVPWHLLGDGVELLREAAVQDDGYHEGDDWPNRWTAGAVFFTLLTWCALALLGYNIWFLLFR
jgi:hypothetical protein